jgi:hypothetical protein
MSGKGFFSRVLDYLVIGYVVRALTPIDPARAHRRSLVSYLGALLLIALLIVFCFSWLVNYRSDEPGMQGKTVYERMFNTEKH